MNRRTLLLGVPAFTAAFAARSAPTWAATRSEVDHNADRALRELYAAQPKARELGRRARAVLIFPRIVKAGFVIGGQSGKGALRVNGHTVAYYKITAASYGIQAGVQAFSYALFFMTKPALAYLERSNGWAIGSGPSVVVVDRGLARSMTTTTVTQDVYAFPFGQRGLMAGMGLEGSKITLLR